MKKDIIYLGIYQGEWQKTWNEYVKKCKSDITIYDYPYVDDRLYTLVEDLPLRHFKVVVDKGYMSDFLEYVYVIVNSNPPNSLKHDLSTGDVISLCVVDEGEEHWHEELFMVCVQGFVKVKWLSKLQEEQ